MEDYYFKLIILIRNSSSIVNPLFRSAVKKVNDIISSNVDFHNVSFDE